MHEGSCAEYDNDDDDDDEYDKPIGKLNVYLIDNIIGIHQK